MSGAQPAGARLVASQLCKAYRRRQVVRAVSFEVDPGEIVGLLGPNGAGKTTSFHMVAGLVRPDSGSVVLGNTELRRLPLYRRARLGLGYLPQEATVFRGLTARQNLLAILESQRCPVAKTEASSWRQARADALLAQFHLTQVADTLGAQLSGGERRRLEMARALIPNPHILLLDEPFAGIDPIAVAEIRTLIRAVRDQGIGVLLTDHNVRETLGICDRAYLISEGQVLLSGPPEAIVAHDIARRTYLGQDFRL